LRIAHALASGGRVNISSALADFNKNPAPQTLVNYPLAVRQQKLFVAIGWSAVFGGSQL
jgi:hypothetical protein